MKFLIVATLLCISYTHKLFLRTSNKMYKKASVTNQDGTLTTTYFIPQNLYYNGVIQKLQSENTASQITWFRSHDNQKNDKKQPNKDQIFVIKTAIVQKTTNVDKTNIPSIPQKYNYGTQKKQILSTNVGINQKNNFGENVSAILGNKAMNIVQQQKQTQNLQRVQQKPFSSSSISSKSSINTLENSKRTSDMTTSSISSSNLSSNTISSGAINTTPISPTTTSTSISTSTSASSISPISNLFKNVQSPYLKSILTSSSSSSISKQTTDNNDNLSTSDTNRINGKQNTVNGQFNDLLGNLNLINNGNYNQIKGDKNTVQAGNNNVILGDGSYVMGSGNIIY